MPALTRGWLIALLVVLGMVQAAGASLSIVLRAAVVSWDSPATQYVDELASQTAPFGDPASETAASARAAATARSCLVVRPVPCAGATPALSSGITRSPPAA